MKMKKTAETLKVGVYTGFKISVRIKNLRKNVAAVQKETEQLVTDIERMLPKTPSPELVKLRKAVLKASLDSAKANLAVAEKEWDTGEELEDHHPLAVEKREAYNDLDILCEELRGIEYDSVDDRVNLIKRASYCLEETSDVLSRAVLKGNPRRRNT